MGKIDRIRESCEQRDTIGPGGSPGALDGYVGRTTLCTQRDLLQSCIDEYVPPSTTTETTDLNRKMNAAVECMALQGDYDATEIFCADRFADLPDADATKAKIKQCEEETIEKSCRLESSASDALATDSSHVTRDILKMVKCSYWSKDYFFKVQLPSGPLYNYLPGLLEKAFTEEPQSLQPPLEPSLLQGPRTMNPLIFRGETYIGNRKNEKGDMEIITWDPTGTMTEYLNVNHPSISSTIPPPKYYPPKF